MGHNIMHTIYQIFLYSIQMYIKSSYFFHGSRITVFTFNKNKKTSNQIKLFFSREPYNRINFYHTRHWHKNKKDNNRIKLFFTSNQAIFSQEPYNHISRITVLSFTVLRHEKQKSNQAIFLRKPYNRFTSDVLQRTLISQKKNE